MAPAATTSRRRRPSKAADVAPPIEDDRAAKLLDIALQAVLARLASGGQLNSRFVQDQVIAMRVFSGKDYEILSQAHGLAKQLESELGDLLATVFGLAATQPE